jgi:ATP-dependent helicase/nuclease subunit B
LRLRALDPLDADPGAAERGQFIHHALDRFIRLSMGALPADAVPLLLAEGVQAFGDALGHPSVAAFWWPRFERIAHWFVDDERQRRAMGTRPLATEIEGGIDFDIGAARFRLTAKADRIDRLPDGRLAIIDYKTGRPPSRDHVVSGFAPQLPLEAVIAERGGFESIAPGEVGLIAFLQLTGGNPPGELLQATKPADQEQAIRDSLTGLLRLVAAFDDPATPYPSKPRPQYAYDGDYDHLARVAEWAAL